MIVIIMLICRETKVEHKSRRIAGNNVRICDVKG